MGGTSNASTGSSAGDETRASLRDLPGGSPYDKIGASGYGASSSETAASTAETASTSARRNRFGGSDPYQAAAPQASSAPPDTVTPSPFATTGKRTPEAGGDAAASSATKSASAPAKQPPPRRESPRGRNWGLPESARGAVPLTRPIQVVVTADAITLRAEAGDRGGNKVIPLAPRTEASLDELVSKIWEHVGQWNYAGQGMYWRPVLVVQVAPDGLERYADLQRLLIDSGLEMRATMLSAPTARR